MKRPELNRRDFNKLTVAAFGGIVAGTAVGCGDGDKKTTEKKPEKNKPGDSGKAKDDHSHENGDHDHEVAVNDWQGDVHVCRGLNACKGKGADGKNACAGQGACATAKAHSCHAENDCKFQGGCGESVGQNTCSKKGECAVPLGENAWKTARAAFESAWKKSEKPFGDAPPKG